MICKESYTVLRIPKICLIEIENASELSKDSKILVARATLAYGQPRYNHPPESQVMRERDLAVSCV